MASIRRLEMALVDRRVIQKGIILAGVVVAVVGLSPHIAVPGISRSGFPVKVEGNSTTVEIVSQDIDQTEAFFGIDVMSVQQSGGNCSAYLLHAGEYERYLNGTSLDGLEVLLEIRHSGRGRYEVMPAELMPELRYVWYGHSATTVTTAVWYPTEAGHTILWVTLSNVSYLMTYEWTFVRAEEWFEWNSF